MRTRNSFSQSRRTTAFLVLAVCAIFLPACRQQMASQHSYRPLQESAFFSDGQASRPLVPGTIARGQLRDDTHLYLGKKDGAFIDTFPFPIDKDVVKRGQERFTIYCSACHDQLGTGNGMIVQRGFRRPPSYYSERLKKAPVGYYYDVITNGFGSMAGYSAQVNVRDRWAIIAYIRALQESQTGAGETPYDPIVNFNTQPREQKQEKKFSVEGQE